jgi:hypothetical protein
LVVRGLDLFDIKWSRKIKITINGKEYARLADVPEDFRTVPKGSDGDGISDAGRQGKKTWRVAGFVRFGGANEPLDAYRGVPVALPGGFQLDDNGLERRISWRWFSWYAMRGIIFAGIFCVPFAFVLYAYANSPDKSWPAPALAITLLLGLPAVVTIYGWLAYLVNRTTVRVDAMRVSVRHGPLPWLGSKDVERADIDGVVSERVINDSDSSDGTIFQPREIYLVKLIFKSGKTRRLVTGLRAPDQALFIEQQIRKA